MITASPLAAQHAAAEKSVDARPIAPARWQILWREALTDPRELLDLLDLSQLAGQRLPGQETGFAVRVPRSFVARMRRGDPLDPLLLQVLPDAAELETAAGFRFDAVGDLDARVGSGILHKYAGRALLIATGSCAVHCRYCFRRHFPYAQETAAANRWAEAVENLRHDQSISEVILSGGDPLSLSTAKLEQLTDALETVPHLRRLRIHTRLPIVLPERVDAELTAWLARLAWPVAVVLHANHANELSVAVAQACVRLRTVGVTLLNQSVLLRRINDSGDALADLSEALFDCGVVPYYLHQLDRVAGTAHFDVDDATAVNLIDDLRVRLPGYLVPRLVREVQGVPHKVPLPARG